MHSLLVPAALVILNAAAFAAQAPRLVALYRKQREVGDFRAAGLL